jgi:3-oxoacyl-(acyl-carrier-protein) synthase
MPRSAAPTQHLFWTQHEAPEEEGALVTAPEAPVRSMGGSEPDGLSVLARARWPQEGSATELPGIAGFVMSSFSPLAAHVAEQCLRAYFGSPPADPARGEGTAIVLTSTSGDIGTATAIADALEAGRRVPPLLFYQSNPNAVAGYIAARWGLSGPVICTIVAGDALADALDYAARLIKDREATAALVIDANQERNGSDHGTAVLLGPTVWPPASTPSGGIP